MRQAPTLLPRPTFQASKPPANPVFVRVVDFLLLLVLLALAPFYLGYLSAPHSSETGMVFIYVLAYHLPVLTVLWLFTLIWGRFRWIPALDRWLPTVALLAVGATFMPLFGLFIFVSTGVLTLCALTTLVAILFDFGRFKEPTVPGAQVAPLGAPPGTNETGGAVQRAVPAAYPVPKSHARVAVKVLLVALAVTLVQTLFSASPLAMVVGRYAANIGLTEPMMYIRQDWFGLVMLMVVVLVVEGLSVKDAVSSLGLAHLRSALIPVAILILPTLPAAFFGIEKSAGAPYISWPPDMPALVFLVLQVLFIEGFYRGYLLGGLTRRANWPWVPAVFISTVLAAGPELEMVFTVEPYWKAILYAVALEAAFSLFSSFLFLANRGNLYPCLVFRLAGPFIVVAVYQGTTTARVILGVWMGLILVVSALVARHSRWSPARATVTAVRSRQT